MTDLTTAQQMLLEAIARAIREESVVWENTRDGDLKTLMALASGHKVLPLVIEAVRGCATVQGWSGLRQQKQLMIRQVLLQEQKTADFLAAYDCLLAAGVKPLVVKGIVCRSLYPNGDYRPSGDEDLLVPGADFETACRVLREFGMAPTEEKAADAFEIGWRKPGSPLYIELHRSLFDPKERVWDRLARLLAKAPDNAVVYEVGGKTVYSLNPHDHMLYLLLHAYKHFVHSGFGIRQVCDIGLWAANYRADIDWQRLYEQCADTGMVQFAAAVLAIARLNLGIDLELPPLWAQIGTDPMPMLRDILGAGIYGSSSRSRQHSAGVTLNAVNKQNKMAKLSGTLFPPAEKLTARYPVLKKHPWLLPAMWCRRIGSYCAELLHARDGNSPVQSIQIARERVALLREYGIID